MLSGRMTYLYVARLCELPGFLNKLHLIVCQNGSWGRVCVTENLSVLLLLVFVMMSLYNVLRVKEPCFPCAMQSVQSCLNALKWKFSGLRTKLVNGLVFA